MLNILVSHQVGKVINIIPRSVQMSVVWNFSSISFDPPNHIYTCMESTHPPAPSLIENITVALCLINDSTAALYIEWSPPSVINGELYSYNIRIDSSFDYYSVYVICLHSFTSSLHACMHGLNFYIIMQKQQTSFSITKEHIFPLRVNVQVNRLN